jgi:hypothetical protein
MLAKAERMLHAANASLKDGFVESAASRSYYAAFHAIQALLKSIDLTYSKHAGVIAAFHREFIKTGIFPPDFGRALTRLAKHRDIGDYSYLWELDPDQVKEDIHKTKEILVSIRRYLGLDKEKE